MPTARVPTDKIVMGHFALMAIALRSSPAILIERADKSLVSSDVSTAFAKHARDSASLTLTALTETVVFSGFVYPLRQMNASSIQRATMA